MTEIPRDIDVTIRAVRGGDEHALKRLAERDSASVPTGRLLVAEQGGELRAALSVDGGQAIADPFHHTAAAVRMLELRVRQLGVRDGRSRFHAVLRPRRRGAASALA